MNLVFFYHEICYFFVTTEWQHWLLPTVGNMVLEKHVQGILRAGLNYLDHPWIRACIYLPRKFNSQENAQHTAAVHCKHLRPALSAVLILNFFLSYTYAQHSRTTVVSLDFIVNWHVSIRISLEVSLSLKLLFYCSVFIKYLFENDVKENSVQRTDWDSNRECLKHSSSTKLLIINYQCIIWGKCTFSNSH